jgi:hypothetical protein
MINRRKTVESLRGIMDELRPIAEAIERREGGCDDAEISIMRLKELAHESNEMTLRHFLASCNHYEYELSGGLFLDAALRFGIRFVEYLEQLAEEKGWTDYIRDMIDEARLEVE